MNLILCQLCLQIAGIMLNSFAPSLFPKLFEHNSCIPTEYVQSRQISESVVPLKIRSLYLLRSFYLLLGFLLFLCSIKNI